MMQRTEQDCNKDCERSAAIPAKVVRQVKAIRKLINFLIRLEQHIIEDAKKRDSP